MIFLFGIQSIVKYVKRHVNYLEIFFFSIYRPDITYFDILRRKIIHSVNLSENFGIFNCWSDFSLDYNYKKDCFESSLCLILSCLASYRAASFRWSTQKSVTIIFHRLCREKIQIIKNQMLRMWLCCLSRQTGV